MNHLAGKYNGPRKIVKRMCLTLLSNISSSCENDLSSKLVCNLSLGTTQWVMAYYLLLDIYVCLSLTSSYPSITFVSWCLLTRHLCSIPQYLYTWVICAIIPWCLDTPLASGCLGVWLLFCETWPPIPQYLCPSFGWRNGRGGRDGYCPGTVWLPGWSLVCTPARSTMVTSACMTPNVSPAAAFSCLWSASPLLVVVTPDDWPYMQHCSE